MKKARKPIPKPLKSEMKIDERNHLKEVKKQVKAMAKLLSLDKEIDCYEASAGWLAYVSYQTQHIAKTEYDAWKGLHKKLRVRLVKHVEEVQQALGEIERLA